MVDYESLGRRLRAKRLSKHLSQQNVADAVKISVTFYGNIERGKRIPSLDTLVAIANYLHIGADYLLADSLDTAIIHRSPEELRILARYLRNQVAELDFQEEA